MKMSHLTFSETITLLLSAPFNRGHFFYILKTYKLKIVFNELTEAFTASDAENWYKASVYEPFQSMWYFNCFCQFFGLCTPISTKSQKSMHILWETLMQMLHTKLLSYNSYRSFYQLLNNFQFENVFVF